jgi:hypothetical protein
LTSSISAKRISVGDRRCDNDAGVDEDRLTGHRRRRGRRDSDRHRSTRFRRAGRAAGTSLAGAEGGPGADASMAPSCRALVLRAGEIVPSWMMPSPPYVTSAADRRPLGSSGVLCDARLVVCPRRLPRQYGDDVHPEVEHWQVERVVRDGQDQLRVIPSDDQKGAADFGEESRALAGRAPVRVRAMSRSRPPGSDADGALQNAQARAYVRPPMMATPTSIVESSLAGGAPTSGRPLAGGRDVARQGE